MKKNHRLFFKWALTSAITIAVIGVLLTTPAAMSAEKSALKIGIIGSGNIGSTLGELWIKAGHEVLFSSRHPEQLQGLVTRLGPKAHAGTPREAATFGDVILVSVPYAALPEIGRDLAKELPGKIVLDTCNPVPNRVYSGIPMMHYNGPNKIKKVQAIRDANGNVTGGNVTGSPRPRGGIELSRWRRRHARVRGDVDDPAPARLDHRGSERANEPERRGRIDLEDAVP